MTRHEELEKLIDEIHMKEAMLYSDSISNIPKNLKEYLNLKQKYSKVLVGEE